jgi:hypothetical protein
MADFITNVAKIVFPEKFKQSFKVEEGDPNLIGAKNLINIFEFDIVKTREIVYENEITENPVEDGFVTSDHIIKRPIQISFDGLISEASVGNSILNGLTRALPFGSTLERKSLTEAFAKLEELRETRTAIVLEVPKGGIFNNMYVKSLKINDDSTTSKSLKFNITFQQLNISFSFIDTTTINRINKAKPISEKGAQVEQESIPKEEIGLFRFIQNRFENKVGNYSPI